MNILVPSMRCNLERCKLGPKCVHSYMFIILIVSAIFIYENQPEQLKKPVIKTWKTTMMMLLPAPVPQLQEAHQLLPAMHVGNKCVHSYMFIHWIVSAIFINEINQ